MIQENKMKRNQRGYIKMYIGPENEGYEIVRTLCRIESVTTVEMQGMISCAEECVTVTVNIGEYVNCQIIFGHCVRFFFKAESIFFHIFLLFSIHRALNAPVSGQHGLKNNKKLTVRFCEPEEPIRSGFSQSIKSNQLFDISSESVVKYCYIVLVNCGNGATVRQHCQTIPTKHCPQMTFYRKRWTCCKNRIICYALVAEKV